MRNHVVRCTMGASLLWVLVGTPLAAQQMVAVSEASQAGRLEKVAASNTGMQTSAAGLSRVVTIDLGGVPLKLALDELARLAHVKIAYSRTTVPLERKVSVRGTRVTLATALQQALQGTGMEARGTPEGDILIVKAGLGNESRAQGTIVGKVIDSKTKRALAGATVTLNDAARGVATSEDGSFRLEVPAGEHTVHIRAVGFVRQAKRVTVTGDQAVVIEVALDASASVLDEVVVTGTVVATERRAIANPITVITAEEIQKRGITRIDQFFRGEVPGVVVLEEGSRVYDDGSPGAMERTLMYSRGVSGLNTTNGATPLKTYIDGVEVLDSRYLGTIDPQSIERVEIITGPQAATVYGSGALGGVMQIFTKKGRGTGHVETTLALQYGILQNNLSAGRTPRHQHALNVTGGTGPEFSFAGTLSYGYTGQWRPGLFSRAAAGSVGVTYSRGAVTATGSVSARAGRNGTAVNNGRETYRARTAEGEHDYVIGTSGIQNQKIGTSNSQTQSLGVTYRVNTAWHHQLTFGQSQVRSSIVPQAPAYGQIARSEDTLYSFNTVKGERSTIAYNTTIQSPVSTFLHSSLTLGVTSGIGDQLSVRGCAPSVSAGNWIACQTGGTGLVVTQPVKDRSWGGFASWRVGMFDKAFLTLGLRGERNPRYGARHKTDWTPTNGLAVNFDIRDVTIKLMGSYGRATRAPEEDQRLESYGNQPAYDPSTYLAQLANPFLTPEYSRGPQGGVEMYFGNRGSLAVNYYKQATTDLIQSISGVDSIVVRRIAWDDYYTILQYQYQNVAKVDQKGIATTGSVNVFPFTLQGTYSWMDSRIVESRTSGFVPGQTFTGVPTHTGNLRIGFAHGQTSATLSTDYIGSKITTEGAEEARIEQGRARHRMYVGHRQSISFGLQPAKTLKGYYKSNLVVSHTVTPWVSASLNIVNVGNDYGSDWNKAWPVLGRQTQVGVTLRHPKR